jgi:hypothetical protein
MAQNLDWKKTVQTPYQQYCVIPNMDNNSNMAIKKAVGTFHMYGLVTCMHIGPLHTKPTVSTVCSGTKVSTLFIISVHT